MKYQGEKTTGANKKTFYVLCSTFCDRRGFTMIETMVAIFVILTAVITPMSIASQALSSSRFAKEQITAFYLAQEGIELVRNIRDNNAIAGTTWNEGILGASSLGAETFCYMGSGCTIDAKNLSVSACSGACPILNIDVNGIYTYSAGTPSSFIRTIKIKVINPNEISITSSISWPKSPAGFTITDNLLNWP